MPLALGLRFLVRLGVAGGVDDVDLALKVAAEAAAGAVVVDDHRDVGLDRAEALLRGLADPEDRARPVDDDRAGHLWAPSGSARGGGLIRSTTAGERHARQAEAHDPRDRSLQQHRYRILTSGWGRIRGVLEPFQVVANREISWPRNGSTVLPFAVHRSIVLGHSRISLWMGSQRTWSEVPKCFENVDCLETLKTLYRRP